MKLVEQHIIKKNDIAYKELDNVCFLSKNLYNSALFSVRQYFFKTKKYLNVYENINNFTSSKQQDYIKLPAKVSQQIMMITDKNFKSFFSSLKSKQNGTNNKKINIPRYLNKTSRFVTIYTSQAVSSKELENGFIKLSGLNIKIPTNKRKINQVRIVPKNNFYVLEVVYELKEPNILDDNNKYCSIDLGVNNLAAVSSNILKPFIISGKPVKSINQFFNKNRSKIISKLEKTTKSRTSNKLKKLSLKRNNKIKNYLHKSSRMIINHLVSNSINTLIIGKNKGWKQEINIGVVNNQNFVSIPHSWFISMLKYKAQMVGIHVIFVDESYTSKCSFIDMEPIKKNKTYMGRRIKRGMFVSKDFIKINADVNGSLNILRKAIPNAFEKGYEIEVCSTPLVLTIK